MVYGENKLNCEIPSNVIFKEPIPDDEVIQILGKTKNMYISLSLSLSLTSNKYLIEFDILKLMFWNSFFFVFL